MSRSVPMTQLTEIAELKDSLHQTPQYVDDGYPMVRVTDIRRGFLNLSDTKKVPLDTYLEFVKRYAPRVGDILFSRVGSYGNSSFVDRPEKFCLGQNTVCISPNRNRVDPFYLYCCINSPLLRGQIDSFVGGASQPTISLKSIAALQVPLPPIAIQQRISDILFCYDRLIENNMRRIKILEQIAQMLYREWFVNFRFPGHEKVRMVDSELGEIPGGWTASTLSEVVGVNDLSIKDDSPEEISYIDIASVSTGSVDSVARLPFSMAPGRARRIVREGDTIWSTVRPNRKSFALILRPEVNLVVSTGFAVLSPRTIPYSYLYCATTTDEFANYLTNHTTGSAYPAVNPKDFEAAKILIPPKVLLDKFHNTVAPMLQLRHVLRMRNACLRTTRDFLLPKLVSGEVSVEQIEAAVPGQTV